MSKSINYVDFVTEKTADGDWARIVEEFQDDGVLADFQAAHTAGTFNDLYTAIESNQAVSASGFLNFDGYALDVESFLGQDMTSDAGQFVRSKFEITLIEHVAFIHFARNLLNQSTEFEYVDILKAGEDEYSWLPQSANAFHRFGPGQEDNFKVVSADGQREYVYRYTDAGFELVKDARNAGSFNFEPGGIDNYFSHDDLDVTPWRLFGNAVDDTTSFQDRNADFLSLASDYFSGLTAPGWARTAYLAFGTSGDDYYEISDSGRSSVSTYNGNDLIISGPQEDKIDGGEGSDTVGFSKSTTGVAVNLDLSYGHNGDATHDHRAEILLSIENLVGSDFSDILIGSAGVNFIAGGLGNDYIDGLTGSDVAVMAGNMSEYGFATGTDGAVLLTKSGETDRLYNIEWLQFDDVLTDINGNTKDGPEYTKTQALYDDTGAEIGSVSLTAPTFTGDGDADYTLTLGGLTGVQFNIAYIIDSSGSMGGNSIVEARSAYVELTERLKTIGLDSIATFAVIPFNSSATTYAPLTADEAITRINSISAGGGTSFGPALTQAASFFSGATDGQTNVAYFLSDGQGSGASSSLTSVANVQAFGIGSGADLAALSTIDSDNAVALSSASQLLDALTGSSVDEDEIDRIEIKVNGTLVQTIASDELTDGELGLQYSGALTGLDTVTDGSNAVVATIFGTDGTEIGSAAIQIAPAKRETTVSLGNNGITDVTFGALTANYEALAGDTLNLTANDLDNEIRAEGVGGSFSALDGDDVIRLGAFATSTVDRVIDGGDGNDVIVYSGNYQATLVNRIGAILKIGTNTDSISNVETVVFDDMILDVATMSVTTRESYFGTEDADVIVGNEEGNQINGRAGDDDINPGGGTDIITLGYGADRLRGNGDSLFGDHVVDFSDEDTLVFEGAQFARGFISVTGSTVRLGIDSNEDAIEDGAITLDGDFSLGDFMAVIEGSDTIITFEKFLPTLQEGQALDPNLVNGIINQNFLKGDGSSDFQVTLRDDMGFAGYNNVVGVYEIDASGNIVDTRILFENANADKSAVAGITDVEAGNRLGFFIVQDAANWAATLADSDTLSFVNDSGADANVSDGNAISIAVNGSAVNRMVFHSFSEDLNSDGVQHALSGVDVGGEAITVGFEDLTGGGDQDYGDVVFRVEVVDDF